MADVVFNVSKLDLVKGDLDFDAQISDIRALLLATVNTGYDDPDLATISALLGVAGVAEPTAGERVVVSSRVTEQDDTNNRANVTAPNSPMGSFAADAGQSAVAVCFYEEGGGTDATRIPISLHDFTSVPLDGGLDIDPSDANDDWLRLA